MKSYICNLFFLLSLSHLSVSTSLPALLKTVLFHGRDMLYYVTNLLLVDVLLFLIVYNY